MIVWLMLLCVCKCGVFNIECIVSQCMMCVHGIVFDAESCMLLVELHVDVCCCCDMCVCDNNCVC